MAFRIIKDSLVKKVLGPAERGRFRTIGYQRQGKAAEEVAGLSRTVQAFWSSGEFPKGSGRNSGPTQHDITYRLEMTVSESTRVDLSVISSTTATAEQIALALSEFQEASALADDSFDELAEILYQIVMDARNIDMGLPKGVLSNRWVPRISKDEPLPRGEFVVLTGSMVLTCQAAEQVPGDTGTEGAVFDVTVDAEGDDVERAGVTGTLGG